MWLFVQKGGELKITVSCIMLHLLSMDIKALDRLIKTYNSHRRSTVHEKLLSYHTLMSFGCHLSSSR